jgi:hypothetical protein
MLSERRAKMTKEELAEIVKTMPQGLVVDDYLVELVSRAIFLERKACIEAIEEEVKDWDRDYKAVALEAAEVILRRP